MTQQFEHSDMPVSHAVPWRDAWQAALYGRDGFYRRDEGPGGHFATNAQGIPGVDEVLAQAIVAMAQRIDADVVVDFACGRGELLDTISRFVDDVDLVGVDVVERPPELSSRIAWVRSAGGASIPSLDVIAGRRAFVVAHEWLDVVPCDIAEADDDGVLREVLVTPDGDETLGAPLPPDTARWAARHAPTAIPVHVGDLRPHSSAAQPTIDAPDDPPPHPVPDDALPPTDGRENATRREPGERVEIGMTRDAAWAALVAEVTRHAAAGSVVVGIDYASTSATRPPFGTLTGFRDGSECAPVPDGSCDVTAHVALDSLDVDDVRTQREVLLELFGELALEPVPLALASSDPPVYLARLAARSALATATHPGGLGAFAWFTRTIG